MERKYKGMSLNLIKEDPDMIDITPEALDFFLAMHKKISDGVRGKSKVVVFGTGGQLKGNNKFEDSWKEEDFSNH